MNIYAPSYYADFKCTAGACRHTCCAGWEIDIDDAALKRYESSEDKYAEHIRNSIDYTAIPHFRLDERERCPHLRRDGLCEIIIRLGEDQLCDICKDHPRFRNFWSGRIEIGLGMVCESAAKLILTQDEPLRLVRVGGNGTEKLNEQEEYLMSVREELLSGITETGSRARLREYLIYRHIADALYDDRLTERIDFIDKAYDCIVSNAASGDTADIAESARVFSDTVEYDDEAFESWLCGNERAMFR